MFDPLYSDLRAAVSMVYHGLTIHRSRNGPPSCAARFDSPEFRFNARFDARFDAPFTAFNAMLVTGPDAGKKIAR